MRLTRVWVLMSVIGVGCGPSGRSAPATTREALLGANGLLDDSYLQIDSAKSADRIRQQLVHTLWTTGYPRRRMPAATFPSEPPYLPRPSGVAQIERLLIPLDDGFDATAYAFRPTVSNGRVALFHQGHSATLDDLGGADTIQFFLNRGFTVLAVGMPLYGENTGPVASHDAMIADGYPLRLFFEPAIVALNWAEAQLGLKDAVMVGISGGGWTTTLLAAIDPRIQQSFPVAGSLPLYLREAGELGDAEQTDAALYEIAGYPDLYLLGAQGRNRRQLQILNRYDSCCFWGTRSDTYAPGIEAAVASYGPGNFSVFVDDTHASHLISPAALGVIGQALDDDAS